MATTSSFRAGSVSALIERESVLAILASALGETLMGSGRLGLLGGEAGVGRTALVQHFCVEHGPGLRVLRGACDPLFTPRPLGLSST